MTLKEVPQVSVPPASNNSVDTIESGIEIRFPVNTGFISRILRVHKVFRYPKVSHCVLVHGRRIIQISMNNGFAVYPRDLYESIVKEEYSVTLPSLSFLDDLSLSTSMFKMLEEQSLGTLRYRLCHTLVVDYLAETDAYSDIRNHKIRHPMDLLWVLVEEYNGSLTRLIRGPIEGNPTTAHT